MKISEAKRILSSIVMYNLEQAKAGKDTNTYVVPFFEGDPGVGKTAIPKQVARELDVQYDQCIVAQYDAGEMAGLSMYNEDKSRMIRLRPDYLPEYYSDPDGKSLSVGIFNLDELPQAFLANQNLVSQMVNEWRIGPHLISPGVTMCCTGNKPENKAGTTSMPSHLKDRLCFLPIEADHDEWLLYAAQEHFDPRVRAYVKQNPSRLSKFDPGAKSCPTCRSWEKVSAVLSMNMVKGDRTHAIKGQIGEGAGTEFEAWLRVENDMPDIEALIKDPDKAPLYDHKKADVLYLLLANLSDISKPDNIANIIRYINRLPNQEFAVFFAHDMIKQHPNLNNHKAVTEWKQKNAKLYL